MGICDSKTCKRMWTSFDNDDGVEKIGMTSVSSHNGGADGEHSSDTGNSSRNGNSNQNKSSGDKLKAMCGSKKTFVLKYSVEITLLIHVTKLVLVTMQMYWYGTDRATFSGIVGRGHITLKHVLVKNWDASWNTPPYPPSHGDFAVYTKDDVESGINFAVSRYYNAEKQATGLYKRMENNSMEAVIKYYDLPDSQDERDDITMTERHFPIEHGLTKTGTGNATTYSYSIANELEYLNLSYAMERMLFTTLKFTIYSFRRSLVNKRPYCLRINGKVTFEDTDINGQVHVYLSTRTYKIKCKEMGLSIADSKLLGTPMYVHIWVIVLCVLSSVIAVLVSLLKVFDESNNEHCVCTGQCGKVTNVFDKIKSAWKELNAHKGSIYVLTSDVVIIIGTFKLNNKSNVGELSELDSGAVWLGTGCIFVWLDSFRYFQVIKWIIENNKFHLLYKVLCRALPGVICYMICAGVIFAGFCLCGFVVLGPYHTKFSTLSSTAVTLFALANADEIYATFYMFDVDKAGDASVLMFSRFYLTIYISIYTYVVVNVLIALFTSAYEVITDQVKDEKALTKSKTKDGAEDTAERG